MLNGAELVLVLGGLLVPPLLAVMVLGALIDRVRRARNGVIARQARLTDAIDGRLGAIVAPVVSKRLTGPWVVSLTIPSQHLMDVGRLVGIVRQALSADLENPGDLRIVLSVLPSPSPLASTSHPKAA